MAAAVAPGSASQMTSLLQSVDLNSGILKADPYVQLTSLLHIDTTKNDLSQFDSVTKASGETFLFRAALHEEYKDADWTMIVTDKAFYKCDPNMPLNHPRKRKPLIDFHSVEADSSNPLAFTTRLYKDSIKSSMKHSLMKFIGNLGSKIDASSLLQLRSYTCQSELQRDQIVFVLGRAVRNEWQSLLEAQLIPDPDYYQTHQFVIKVNRKGAQQERLLVLSNEWLYNVEVSHGPTKISDVKWGIHLQALQAIAIEAGAAIVLYFDQEKVAEIAAKHVGSQRQGLIVKDTDNYVFTFPDDSARASFVAILAHVHTRACKADTPALGLMNNTTGKEVHYIPASPKGQGDGKFQTSVHAVPATPQNVRDIAGSPMGAGRAARTFNFQGPSPATPAKPAAAAAASATASASASAVASPDRPEPSDEAVALHRSPGLASGMRAAPVRGQRGSVIGSAPAPAVREEKPLLLEELEKMVKDSVKSHTRTFALYPDLTIKWGDSANKFKYTARVLSVITAGELQDRLAPEKKPKFFALKTTEKPLYLVAPTVHARATWLSLIDSLLVPGAATLAGSGAPNALANSSRALESSLPVIKGPMVKYIKGGRDKHVKFFCVYPNGTIKWGDSEAALKHTAQVLDIDQDLAELDDKISRADAIRFVRLRTSEKTLELMCPNQDSADHWMITVTKLLNPDADDYQGEGYGYEPED
jgi:hypothetical protein